MMQDRVVRPRGNCLFTFCIVLVLSTAYGQGITLDSNLFQWDLVASLDYINPSNSYLGGPMYPKDTSGKVRTEYNVFWKFFGFYEQRTNRYLQGGPPSSAVFTAINQLSIFWQYSAPYTIAEGRYTITLTDSGQNTTVLNNTLIGVGGLKIGSVITNDSNIFNASTTKVFFLSLAFSHPVRNYSHSRYPTPYQENFIFQTDFYNVVLNQPNLAISDQQESSLNVSTFNMTYDSNGEMIGIVFNGTTEFESSWIYDPEIAILLHSESSSSDGSSEDSSLAYLALIALILAPLLVVAVIAVVTAVGLYLRMKKPQTTNLAVNFSA